ncbi:hypothetical protein NPIL_459091, partial [Nephila pilipes]
VVRESCILKPQVKRDWGNGTLKIRASCLLSPENLKIIV